ncbi:DUF1330 domain-containing protein [Chitinophaga sp. MM2321]|uniref:DUF1330 domain-containing protein n=1 Tax=Chitinophaga sp. MM2321 TaxID=3137178 RepID=UPI0032D59BD9
MIYITQLIYINQGQEAQFDQFESVAIPIISRYNGRLLFRLRPAPDHYIEATIDHPYEIHLVTFDNEADFEAFKADKERDQVLHLKNASVKKIVLVKGVAL